MFLSCLCLLRHYLALNVANHSPQVSPEPFLFPFRAPHLPGMGIAPVHHECVF